jgi:hypothetical protein
VVDTNLKVTKKGKIWMNRFESVDNWVMSGKMVYSSSSSVQYMFY